MEWWWWLIIILTLIFAFPLSFFDLFCIGISYLLSIRRLWPVFSFLFPRTELSTPALIEKTRKNFAALPFYIHPAHRPHVQKVEDLKIVTRDGAEIRVRYYQPVSVRSAPLVYIHGGGWVLMGLETHEPSCYQLVATLGCPLFSIEYRLAPEFSYPHPLHDCLDAITSLVQSQHLPAQYSPSRQDKRDGFFIMGDSAGGNLTAAVCLQARDTNMAWWSAVRGQILIYPVTDYNFDTVSYKTQDNKILARSTMQNFWSLYTPTQDMAVSPYASVLRAPSLRGLPPTFVLVVRHDVLRDEGVAYAKAMEEQGVEVELMENKDLFHGFFSTSFLKQTELVMKRIARFVARCK
eukprot:TRINITY_DN721_c0_g6_i1.p1 TRINITY_DN721_c0_g6~~TRINITY_DN721_c0_g6_i1.p1  ORF type:complete len:349 (-),score=47.28 TRINITY_DN721_c0_g6_i1:163-1209(-)